MIVRKPEHDSRIKGPHGLDATSTKCRGVVIHTTEGVVTPDSDADRHQVIDYLANVRGLSVPAVADDDGSTQMIADSGMGAHAACIHDMFGVEQCATAKWSRDTWLNKHREAVRNSARWAAYWVHQVMGLPVTLKVLKAVVIGHNQDYRFGGCSTHTDPGGGYPWDIFREDAIEWATEKGYRIVATKGDLKKARSFRASRAKQAWAFARRWSKIGWRIVVSRRYHQADLS